MRDYGEDGSDHGWMKIYHDMYRCRCRKVMSENKNKEGSPWIDLGLVH